MNYTGVISPSFFVEGTYSNRNLKFVDSGAKSTESIDGTLVVDTARGSRFWAPTFCGACGLDEERNNINVVVKGTYFASTRGRGSHNVVFGYDTFNDVRLAENHQSGSDYRILGTTSIIRGSEVYPSWTPGSTTIIQWNPIDAASLGTDFRTHSLFVNDQWRVNSRLTANVGLRWDRNDGVDSAGNRVADDSGVSPRLAVTFDPAGDARWTVNASYGKYIAGLANNVADSASNGGVPSTFQYEYLGPPINTDVNAPASSLVTTDVALRTLFDWSSPMAGRTARRSASTSRVSARVSPRAEVPGRARVHERRHAADRRKRSRPSGRRPPHVVRLLLLAPRRHDGLRARPGRHPPGPHDHRQQQRAGAPLRGGERPGVVPVGAPPQRERRVHALADVGELRRRNAEQRTRHRRNRERRERDVRADRLGRVSGVFPPGMEPAGRGPRHGSAASRPDVGRLAAADQRAAREPSV